MCLRVRALSVFAHVDGRVQTSAIGQRLVRSGEEMSRVLHGTGCHI